MYPDPFNRISFEDHLDRYPAHSLSQAQVRYEMAYWAEWIDQQGMIANEPAPRVWLKIKAITCAAFGLISGLLGPLGFISGDIGQVLTAIGFIAAVWGLFLSASLRAEKEEPARAAQRVDFRISALVARRRAFNSKR